MTRREALLHTASLLGIALSPAAIHSALAQISRDPTGRSPPSYSVPFRHRHRHRYG
ncbi:MAG: hypothetical protein J6386_18935 [Candidatus Synoicihabitans palmerolidicus]|nr:hypothetical protein [Candidatus Synoicihabitans palmerolidicus]